MIKKRVLLDGSLFRVKKVKLGDVVFEMWTLIAQLKCHMQEVEMNIYLSSAAQPAVLTALSPDIITANS